MCRSFHIIFAALYDKAGVKNHGKRVSLCPFGQTLRAEYVRLECFLCVCAG